MVVQPNQPELELRIHNGMTNGSSTDDGVKDSYQPQTAGECSLSHLALRVVQLKAASASQKLPNLLGVKCHEHEQEMDSSNLYTFSFSDMWLQVSAV